MRVDHKIADIQSMEVISKDIDELFAELQEKYSIGEYIEISTCNRKEIYIHNENIPEDEELLSHENQSIVIDYGPGIKITNARRWIFAIYIILINFHHPRKIIL